MQYRFEGQFLRKVGRRNGAKQQYQCSRNQSGADWVQRCTGFYIPVYHIKITSHQNSPQNEGVFPVQIVADNGKIRCKPPVSFDKKDGISRNNNISYQVKHNAKIPLQINLQKSSIPECKRYRVKFL